jgi:hydroxypyruvate isomerase
MTALAPNIEIFFTDISYEERITRMADMGFKAVDMFSHENKNHKAIGKVCEKCGITISMVVGNVLTKGYNDRSLHDGLVKHFEEVAAAAVEMQACNIVVLSGNTLPRVPFHEQDSAIIDGLKRLIPIIEKYNVTAVLEMLNSLYDHPGYYLDNTRTMFNIIKAISHPGIKALYDIYHAGIMCGNIVEDIKAGIELIGHFHIAGIPGRHEPKHSELNYPFIVEQICNAGYKRYIGLEYWPVKPHKESLIETKEWLVKK